MKYRTIILLLALSLSGITSQAQVNVYVAPPNVETAEASFPTVDLILTEDFNALATGSFPSSYYSAAIDATYSILHNNTNGDEITINQHNQYGSSPDNGNYLSVGAGSQLQIALHQEVQYFGFNYNAGDPRNSIKIYHDDTLLLEFTTQSLIDLLPNSSDSSITASDNNTYATHLYYGQPFTGLNANEPYAYLHFVANDEVRFNRIVLEQGATSNFESDNHSVLVTRPDDLNPTPVPEPSTALLGLLGLALFNRRRR